MIDQLQKLELKDGDILRFPAGTDIQIAEALCNTLREIHPGKRFVVVCGDLEQIPNDVREWLATP